MDTHSDHTVGIQNTEISSEHENTILRKPKKCHPHVITTKYLLLLSEIRRELLANETASCNDDTDKQNAKRTRQSRETNWIANIPGTPLELVASALLLKAFPLLHVIFEYCLYLLVVHDDCVVELIKTSLTDIRIHVRMQAGNRRRREIACTVSGEIAKNVNWIRDFDDTRVFFDHPQLTDIIRIRRQQKYSRVIV